MFNPFNMIFSKRIVGVDIGTFAIKIVELSSRGKNKRLENYGYAKSSLLPKKPLLNKKTESAVVESGFAGLAIREILDEAKIKTKAAIFSIPDFSTFCTSFDIPPMTEKEIPEAIRYNASQYITLPISEVTLDWRIVSNALPGNDASIKVFIVAIPNQVVQEYQAIARDAELELYALESEVFGITKALAKDNKKTICAMDIGFQSSTMNIIDQGFLKRSYSFNFNSNQLINVSSSRLGAKDNLNYLESTVEKTFNISLVDSLLAELKNISAEFLQSEQKQIQEVYLTGGSANVPGLKEYFSKVFNKEISIPNCFSGFLYPPILKESLLEMSPSFSVAVGVALDGLEI